MKSQILTAPGRPFKKLKLQLHLQLPQKGRDAAPRQWDVPAAIRCNGNEKARVERAYFAGVLKIKI